MVLAKITQYCPFNMDGVVIVEQYFINNYDNHTVVSFQLLPLSQNDSTISVFDVD